MNYLNTFLDYARILFSTSKSRREELENSLRLREAIKQSHRLTLREVLVRAEKYFSSVDFNGPLSPEMDRQIDELARKYGIEIYF